MLVFKVEPVWGSFIVKSFLVLNFLDYILTVAGLKNGLKEGNPTVNNFVDNDIYFVVFKLGGCILVLLSLVILNRWTILKLVTIGLYFVCLWNIYMLTTLLFTV